MKDPRWRLNNLYHITDKNGRRIKFKLNWAQESLFNGLHFQNVVLKARQLGFTSFIQLLMLDACLFNSHVRAGTIAHRLDDAKTIFRDKVRYPYENLPDGLKAARPIVKDAVDEMMFNNNSSIRIGTSLRSGTLQYLHISEYGKLCAQFPEKAREVRTGALNTVQAGQIVFLESTAEGREGHFYDICEMSRAKQRIGLPLTPLDFRFHFFPWWRCPDYEIDPNGVVVEEQFRRYFDQLETTEGIVLSPAQQAWYTKKAETQLADMKREYPSTPEEAFEASVEGAYYGQEMAAAELQGRVGHFPASPELSVHTSWDIGRADYTSIWFFQRLGKRIRLVGFFQNAGEGMPYFAEECRKLYEAKGWRRKGAVDFVPHDARVVEWGSDRSRIEQMFSKRLNPQIATELDLADGINAVRAILPICEFDAQACAEGISMLKGYRKEWDEIRGVWKDKPRHDICSHGSDAFRYLACAYRDLPPPAPVKDIAPRWAGSGLTVDDLIKLHENRGRERLRV